MYAKIVLSTVLGAATLLAGGTKSVSLKIPDEMAPPGGMVQMKLMVTEPTPISTGSVGFTFDSSTFASVQGISVFNMTGDVSGAAVIQGNQLWLRYTTTTGASGTDYPIMSFALAVREDALPGQKTQFSLDPNSLWLLNFFGYATLRPIPPANITVGGSISITNVTPGGGVMPAGSILTIHGIGFQPKTQVQVSSNLKISSIKVVSPERIDLTIGQTGQVTGTKIQVVNPDGSQDVYFSYMRGVPVGSSTQPLLAATVPVFSVQTLSQATFVVPPVTGNQFVGLAMQNQNLSDVSITLKAYSLSNGLLDQTTLTLPPAMRITRTLGEWMPNSGGATFVTVSASAPIQAFGLFGDPGGNSVVPFRAALMAP